MADKSITGLTAAGTITGAELVKVVQGGNSRKVDLDTIIAALSPTGIDGVDGRTVLNGTVIPTTEGVDGDFYIRTTNYTIYGPKTGGAWGSGVSLVGSTGADGADGDDGLDGTDGQSLLSGSGAPGGGLGNDGDMYLDYTAYDIYGPKAGGVWGSGTSILGTIGSNGKTILNGTVDPTTEGTDGDFYINTSSSFIFGPKAGGTWPAGTSIIGPAGSGSSFLSDSGAPDNSSDGVNGDFYMDTTGRALYGPKAGGVWPTPVYLGSREENFIIALSDLTTALTTGTAKETFRVPYAFTLTAVRASLATAQSSGSILTVDINEGGVSILSTKLTIDNGEKTSTTAATAAVISDTSLADDAELTFYIDQAGSGGLGLKVTLIGYRT